jgi:hypothetical protein
LHGVAQVPLWQVRPVQHSLELEHSEPLDLQGVVQAPFWHVSPEQHWLVDVQP